MSNYLGGKFGHFIISAGSTPTSTEIANNNFVAKLGGLRESYDSLATEDSGRSNDGYMHIYWIKNKYIKLEIDMPPLSLSKSSKILQLVQGKKYYITYIDVRTNSEKTTYVYTSNSQADCYTGVVVGTQVEGLSFSAVEIAGENV